MQLEQALKIFNLGADYSREDVETFYQFESSLLEERLTVGNDEQKLRNKQKILELQAAYNALQAAGAPADKSMLAKIGTKRLITYLLLVVIGAAAISASVFTLKKRQAENDLAEQSKRQQIVDDAAAKAREKIAPIHNPVTKTEEKITISPQQAELNQLKQQGQELMQKWQKLTAKVGFGLPEELKNRLFKATKLSEEGSFSQAIFVYQRYLKEFAAHIDNVGNYMQAFSEHSKYEQQWHDLASRENYTAMQLGQFQQQFSQTREQLEKGEMAQYTRESLEGINLRYKVMIAQGERIAKLRREYWSLKVRWQRNVLHNGFYKLTPAIRDLIKTAEQKKLDAGDFNKLEDQVYQRLINHFKQNLRR